MERSKPAAAATANAAAALWLSQGNSEAVEIFAGHF